MLTKLALWYLRRHHISAMLNMRVDGDGVSNKSLPFHMADCFVVGHQIDDDPCNLVPTITIN